MPPSHSFIFDATTRFVVGLGAIGGMVYAMYPQSQCKSWFESNMTEQQKESDRWAFSAANPPTHRPHHRCHVAHRVINVIRLGTALASLSP